MGKIILGCHPSVVVAYSQEVNEFLMSVYDQGYPRKSYRGSANNIGGNPEGEDKDPESVLLKEIAEEFDPNHSLEKMFVGPVNWASDNDIRYVRNSLIAGVEPLQDFMVRQPGEIEGCNAPYQGIYSVFYTSIPSEAIECAKRNLGEGKNIVTEGDCGVFSIKDLESSPRREFSTAHITAHILNWKFGSKIPHPKGLEAEPIGMPRKSYKHYADNFMYDNKALIRASRVED